MQKELHGVKQRIAEYTQFIAAADQIIIMGGCDDGRVGAPAKLFDIHGSQALVIYVPMIGGGVVDIGQLQQIITYCVQNGANRDSLSIMWTQHGSSEEVSQALACKHGKQVAQECISCGLRGVVQTASNEFGSFFSTYAEVIRENGSLSYGQLLASIDTHNNSGQIFLDALSIIAQRFGVTARLIWIALTKNYSGDIIENLTQVTKQLQTDANMLDLGVPIYGGLFNHATDEVTVVEPGNETRIIASGEPIQLPLRSSHPEDLSFQDPRVLVLAVGPDSHIPDGVIFPRRVGSDEIDNDFSAATLGLSQEDILNKLAELCYPASAKNAKHGKNFEHAEEMIIRCSTNRETALVLEALASTEFSHEMRPLFAAAFGTISIVTLETEKVTVYELKPKQ